MSYDNEHHQEDTMSFLRLGRPTTKTCLTELSSRNLSPPNETHKSCRVCMDAETGACLHVSISWTRRARCISSGVAVIINDAPSGSQASGKQCERDVASSEPAPRAQT